MATGNGQRLPYVALLALCVFAVPVLAQVTGPETPNNSQQPDPIKSGAIQMNVEMALVNVTVTDPYSRLVTGLDKIREAIKQTAQYWSLTIARLLRENIRNLLSDGISLLDFPGSKLRRIKRLRKRHPILCGSEVRRDKRIVQHGRKLEVVMHVEGKTEEQQQCSSAESDYKFALPKCWLTNFFMSYTEGSPRLNPTRTVRASRH